VPGGSVRLEVPHGVIIVGDRDAPVPASFGEESVAASESVVAVATQHEVDGEVTIRLTDAADARPLAVRAFAGRLTVPSGRVTICNTSNDVLLEVSVCGGVAQVTVWANDARNPDEVVVAVE
jgi:hypothetical protein